jgi:single-strand DNA-binding protein
MSVRAGVTARRRVCWCHAPHGVIADLGTTKGNAMHDVMMTISGNVVEKPKLRRTRNGHYVANFRVASTARRYDREKGAWVDGDTLFVSVSAWRGLGQNVAESLDKGLPVIVHGRYYQREYKQDEMVRTAYELDAVAVGPDLNRGTTQFRKVNRSAVATEVDLDAEGIPADQSDKYIQDIVEDDVPAGVDPATGEVRELATVS